MKEGERRDVLQHHHQAVRTAVGTSAAEVKAPACVEERGGSGGAKDGRRRCRRTEQLAHLGVGEPCIVFVGGLAAERLGGRGRKKGQRPGLGRHLVTGDEHLIICSVSSLAKSGCDPSGASTIRCPAGRSSPL